MFHLFHGKVTTHHDITYLENELLGIEVIYHGKEKKGTFFLFPQLDQTTGTMRYYAFDKAVQKEKFVGLTKIQGIGGKTGYHLAMLPEKELEKAIHDMDLQYFQKVPGIGPKTAKRVVLELKQSVSKADLGKLDIDEQLYKDIVGSLHGLGYERSKVKKLLPDCPVKLTKKNLPDIMKWLIDHL